MELKPWISRTIRIAIALILGLFLLRFLLAGVAPGGQMDLGTGLVAIMLAVLYGLVLFALFGWSILQSIGERFGNSLYMPSDVNFQIMPEYSTAEALVNKGKYQDAIDEYRKVILEYPEDIYPHLRIAELAVNHLNDLKLAELELLSAMGKAKGEDSTALAAGRLADFYQHTLQDPVRALEVMKQLREKIPGTKQAKLAEERIALLEGIAQGNVVLPKTPDKIAHRRSRYSMWG
jgi:predicted negative regulator of RcsB-dependent stress response